MRDMEARRQPQVEAPMTIALAKRPLRVAVFAYEFPALSETFVLNQVTGLIDRGHHVTVFATAARADPMVHPDVVSYGLDARIRYRAMPAGRIERVMSAPAVAARAGPGNAMPFLRSLNVARYGADARSLSLFYWSGALQAREEYDVIHCHFGTVGREVAFLREIGAIRGKLAVSFHGVDMSACLEAGDGLYRHLFEKADLLLPISEHWRRRLLEMGADAARMKVHRMGIDLERFPFRQRCASRDREFQVLTIGRLVEKKGIEYALRAVAGLAASGMPVRYSIVGDGPLRRPLVRLATELGIAGQVHFLGWKDQACVAALMKKSDVLLAPSVTDSRGDQEGIPVTLMEAMASGVPVVSTRHSGIPELVISGETGLLLEERDVLGLRSALAYLWQNQGQAEELSMAARARVAREFDVRVLNARLEAHYEQLVVTSGAPEGQRS